MDLLLRLWPNPIAIEAFIGCLLREIRADEWS
jgi:hypothetical protein